jgi:hypothetical protein
MERDTGLEPEIFINDSECLRTVETELTRNLVPLAESSRHSEGPNAESTVVAEVSDADLRRALVAAVLGGMAAAAATLATTLDERRRRRTPANVVNLDERQGR